MTLLGVGEFQMGTTSTASAPAEMDLSLDEVIKSRAAAVKKTVSNVDRSIATSRARRDAAVNARRGIAPSAKPTQMQIETEVQKQANKTAIKRAVQQKQQKQKMNTNLLSPKEKMAVRKHQREVQAAGKKAAAAENVVLPSKKLLKAARAVMVSAGYVFPPNYELKVAPKEAAAAAPPPLQHQQQPKQPPNSSNNNAQQQQPKKRNNNNRRGGGGGGTMN